MLLVLVLLSAIRRSSRLAGDAADPSSLAMVEFVESERGEDMEFLGMLV